MNEEFETYENTEANAAKIGWNLTPEYCVGDTNAPYVTHDHVQGVFKFHEWRIA